jgi:hypothetical protein
MVDVVEDSLDVGQLFGSQGLFGNQGMGKGTQAGVEVVGFDLEGIGMGIKSVVARLFRPVVPQHESGESMGRRLRGAVGGWEVSQFPAPGKYRARYIISISLRLAFQTLYTEKSSHSFLLYTNNTNNNNIVIYRENGWIHRGFSIKSL